MAHARKALIIAPDDVPGEYGNYAAACQALNLEPNEHCYVVCRVSTEAGPRTLLTVDLDLLQDTEKAGTSDQASLLSAGRSKETASGKPFAASRLGQEPNPFDDFCRQERPGGRTAGQPDHPVVQLVLDRDRATLKGVAVWNPRTGQGVTVWNPRIGQLGIASEAVEAAVREAFADTAAEATLGTLWPPRAAPPALADVDTALMVLKGALDPQTFLLKMVNVAARVVAVHVGLGAVAPLVGHFAEDLCKQYVCLPCERILVNVLSSVDIDLYAAAGKLTDCATLRELTCEETSHEIENLFRRFGDDVPGARDQEPGAENVIDVPPLPIDRSLESMAPEFGDLDLPDTRSQPDPYDRSDAPGGPEI